MWFTFWTNWVLWKSLVKRIQQNFMLRSSFSASIIFPCSIIYLDFFKSFDMVLYNILLSKLERDGFDGWPVWWMRSWWVVVKGSESCWTPVVSLGDPYWDQWYLIPSVMTQKGSSAPSAVCWWHQAEWCVWHAHTGRKLYEESLDWCIGAVGWSSRCRFCCSPKIRSRGG